MNILKIKRSSTAAKVPTGLQSGELAVNLVDRKLYAGTDAGTVVQIGNDPNVDTLNVTGTLTAGGKITGKAGLNITGDSVTSGTVYAQTGLDVNGPSNLKGKVKLHGNASDLELPYRLILRKMPGMAGETQISAMRSDNDVNAGFPTSDTRVLTIRGVSATTGDPNASANFGTFLINERANTGAGVVAIQAFGPPTATGATGQLKSEIALTGEGNIYVQGTQLSAPNTRFHVGIAGVAQLNNNGSVTFMDATTSTEKGNIWTDTAKNMYFRVGTAATGFVARLGSDGTWIAPHLRVDGFTNLNDTTSINARLIVSEAIANITNASQLTVNTSQDLNQIGDGQTHIGYATSDGKLHHYFRGKGVTNINTLGGLWVQYGLRLNDVPARTPSILFAPTATADTQNLLRQFKSSATANFWSEQVQNDTYEIDSGNTAQNREFILQGGTTPSATFRGDIIGGGDISAPGTLDIGGINAGGITSTGDVVVGTGTTNADVTINGNLTVTGTINGSVSDGGSSGGITGPLDTLTVTGLLTAGETDTTTLTVTGQSTLGNISGTALTLTSDASVGGKLTVTGTSTLQAISGTTLSLSSDASVAGGLTVTGQAKLGAISGSTLNTSSDATVGGKLTVTGSVIIKSVMALTSSVDQSSGTANLLPRYTSNQTTGTINFLRQFQSSSASADWYEKVSGNEYLLTSSATASTTPDFHLIPGATPRAEFAGDIYMPGTLTADTGINTSGSMNVGGSMSIIGDCGVSGNFSIDGEVQGINTGAATGTANFRAVSENGSGVIVNDGTNVYVGITAAGDVLGPMITDIIPIQIALDGSHIAIGQGMPSYMDQLTVSGSVTAASFPTSSDIRFKKNIQDAMEQYDNLHKVKIQTYDFDNGNYQRDNCVGVIAQAMDEVYPGIVSINADGYKSVNYTELSVYLWKIVQEMDISHKAEIAELKKQIDAIKKAA